MANSSQSNASQSPVPSKQSVLTRLKANVRFSAVVDVGVRECTGELIENFSELKHYLFEPVPAFFADIAKNYAKTEHELFPMALSNADGRAYLVSTSLHQDGQVTHSQIRDTPATVDGRTVVGCDVIEFRRFDSLPVRNVIPEDFLLKVDVDGKDLEVVEGFGEALGRAAAVVIECTTRTMIDRVTYLAKHGFEIVDLVDLVYYGQSLYQFDAVLVRRNLINDTLRPDIRAFDARQWRPLGFE